MALPAERIFKNISDFWKVMPKADRDALAAYWQAMFERTADINLGAQQLDLSKSIAFVPVVVRSTDVPFLFDAAAKLADTRSGYTFGYNTQPGVIEIPKLRGGFESTEALELTVTADYLVEEGKIFFVVEPPPFLFAPVANRNLELVWRNFGFLIDFFRKNSTNYRRRVQGLWFALFGGASVKNIQLGMSALMDMPFTAGGTVSAIRPNDDGSSDVVIGEEIINVPPHLVPKISVSVGDVIEGYQAIVDGVVVEDFVINPDIASKAGVPRVQELFTFLVTVEADDVVEMVGPLGSLQGLFDGSIDFIERAKPAYTDFVAGLVRNLGDDKGLGIATESEPRIVEIGLPSTVNFNPVNLHFGIDKPDMKQGVSPLTEEYYSTIGGDEDLDLDGDSLMGAEFLKITSVGPGGDINLMGWGGYDEWAMSM